jgi:predicted acyl esterase
MRSRTGLLLGLAAVVPALAATGTPLHAGAQTAPFTKTSALHFTATKLGPASSQSCDIVYDLYVPSDASATHQVPAILTTNGFGGSKDDQAGVAAMLATHDYEVLSYSGLGFGGSSCNIELDSPEWDGRAASELVDLLAAQPEVAKDAPGDPVVGTWGGSYGGGFQFALASVDPRVDAMIPQITWNDLAYSLAPNNDSASYNYASSPPGAPKFEWTDLFFADGMAQVALHPGTSGNPPTGCPGFDQQVCVAQAETTALGYGSADTIALLRHASAEYELFEKPGTHVPPMLLMQGQNDTLFDFADAVANYDGAIRRGAPVKLVLKEGGHSGPAAPGEVNDGDPSKGYLDQLYLSWYDRYLKHLPVDTGPQVEWFRDWVSYDHNGSAQPAYASSQSWPVGPEQRLWLSGGSLTGGGDLVDGLAHVVAGSQTFVNPPVGQPSSYSETSDQGQLLPPTDPPGEFASWSTAPLAADTDVVGIPQLTFHVSAPATSNLDPTTELVLYGKLYDVDAAGTKTLVHGLVAPLRVADTSGAVHLNLPGVVHRYAAGHRIELVLASTDSAYAGSRVPGPITVSVDRNTPSYLTLPLAPAPVTASTAIGGSAATALQPAAAGGADLASLPNTAAARPQQVLGLGAVGLGLVVVATRRRRRSARTLP